MREENIYKAQPGNLKINPKYYALIWIVAVVCAFFSGIYSTIQTFIQSENIALTIYSTLIDIAVGGGVNVLLTWLIAMLLYNMGAKRGLRAIPKNDFIYSIMILMSIIWFVSGILGLFCFVDPIADIYNVFVVLPILTTVLSALMFFLVYVPNYLNPRMAKRYFDYYGKMYVIFNAVIYFLSAFSTLISVEIVTNPTIIELIKDYYAELVSMSVSVDSFVTMLIESSINFKIATSLSIAITAGMIVAYVVLSKKLAKSASEYKEEAPSDDMNRVIFTDGTNFYSIEDLKNNPFNADASKNPFEEEKKDDKVFDEFDL